MTRHSCGYEWELVADTLMRNPGCPVCSGNKRKDTREYYQQVKDLVGEEYCVNGEYTFNKCKMEFTHNECGNVFMMEAKAFLAGQRCPECKKKHLSKRFRKTHEEFIEEVANKTGMEYEVLEDYTQKDKPIKMKHIKCGTVFHVTPNHFLSSMNSRCPYCKSSKGEKEIEKYLVQQGTEFETQYRLKDCKNKRPLPFDFAIFSHGELKMLIEFDGIQHFNPKWGIKEFERTKENDKIKDKYCQEKQIPLLRIPYNTENIISILVKNIIW